MYDTINEDSIYRCTDNIPCENGYFPKGSYVYVTLENDGTVTLYDFRAGCKNGYLFFDEFREDEYMNTSFFDNKNFADYLQEERDLSEKTEWYEGNFRKARKTLSKFELVEQVVFTICLIIITINTVVLAVGVPNVGGLCVGLSITASIGTIFCVSVLLLKKSLEKEARSRFIRHMCGLYNAHQQREREYV